MRKSKLKIDGLSHTVQFSYILHGLPASVRGEDHQLEVYLITYMERQPYYKTKNPSDQKVGLGTV